VVNVLLDEPTAISSDFILENPLCTDDNNGWIMAENTAGGSEPYLYSTAGIYEITVEDANGCIVSIEETLINPAPVFVNLGTDTLVTSGTELDIRLVTNSSNPDTIIWTPFEILDTIINFTATVTANNPIELSAMLIDENGCVGNDDILIRVNKDRNVFIPNAISPNFDGINDKFVIHGGVGVEKIRTYDNQMLNDQVLVYVVEILFTDGETEIFKGDVTLMR